MNTLLLAAMVAEGVVAIGFIGLPGQLLGPLGVTLDPAATPAVLLLITQLGGLMNALGWILVALHAVFTIWFGAFLTK